MLSSHFLTRVPTPDNGPGAASTTLPMAERTRLYSGFRWIEVRYFDIAPTLGAIDISLSLRTTMKSRSDAPALFNPSYASPQVRAPSPSTETTLNDSPFRSRATAMPYPAEIAVPAWPA